MHTLKTLSLVLFLLSLGCMGSTDTEWSATAGLPAEARASVEARPPWRGAREAIGDLSLSDLLVMGRGSHEGPLHGGMLLCSAETTYSGGDRKRTWAARRGVDTSLPDINADLSMGTHRQSTSGPDNTSQTLAGLSMVDLEAGSEVRLSLADRGFLRQHHFDSLSGSYAGQLPMRIQGENSQATCYAVPAADVQAAVERRLAAADVELARLEQRSVDLGASDLGRGLSPDPRDALDIPAALVGWHQPALVERVARVQAADDDFRRRVIEEVTAAVAYAPALAEISGSTVRPVRMRCPRPLGFVRRGYSAACVLEVEVTMSPAPDARLSLEVVTVDGDVLSLLGTHLPRDAGLLDSVERGWPDPGKEVVVLHGYHREYGEPLALRAWGAEGAVWIGLSEVTRW